MSPPLTITEDTPPDMLAGAMDLTVVLPTGKNIEMSVERSTPMMDLLVSVTTSNKISPGGHVLQAFGERGMLPYKPSTPIGALDTWTVYIVPKKQTGSAPLKCHSGNTPFEQTFRLQVHLPRNQLYVSRVSFKTKLQDILTEVCAEKDLDVNKYCLTHPDKLDQVLNLSKTFLDYKLQQVSLVSKANRPVTLSTSDIMSLKANGNRKYSASHSYEGSTSSGSLEGRSLSPSRSEESGSSPTIQKLGPFSKYRKRRPAPKPPQNKKADPLVIYHSRNSSDSSGYHESSILSESPESNSLPDSLPRRSKLPPATNVETRPDPSGKMGGALSRSLSNLTAANGGKEKRSGRLFVSNAIGSSKSYSSTSASLTCLPGAMGKKKKAPAPPPPVFKSMTSLQEEECDRFEQQPTPPVTSRIQPEPNVAAEEVRCESAKSVEDEIDRIFRDATGPYETPNLSRVPSPPLMPQNTETEPYDWQYKLPEPPSAFRDNRAPTPSPTEYETISIGDILEDGPGKKVENEVQKEAKNEIRAKVDVEKEVKMKNESTQQVKDKNDSQKEIGIETVKDEFQNEKIIEEINKEPDFISSEEILPSKKDEKSGKICSDFSKEPSMEKEMKKCANMEKFPVKNVESISKIKPMDEKCEIEKTPKKILEPEWGKKVDVSNRCSVLKNFTISAYESSKPTKIFNDDSVSKGDEIGMKMSGKLSILEKAVEKGKCLDRRNSLGKDGKENVSAMPTVKRSKSHISLLSGNHAKLNTLISANRAAQQSENGLRKIASDFFINQNSNKECDEFLELGDQVKHPEQKCVNNAKKDTIEKGKERFSSERMKSADVIHELQSLQVMRGILPKLQMSQVDTGVENIRSQAKEPPKANRCHEGPSVNLGSWNERPKRQVSIKKDRDYVYAAETPSLSSFREPEQIPEETNINDRIPIVRAVELKKPFQAILKRPQSCYLYGDTVSDVKIISNGISINGKKFPVEEKFHFGEKFQGSNGEKFPKKLSLNTSCVNDAQKSKFGQSGAEFLRSRSNFQFKPVKLKPVVQDANSCRIINGNPRDLLLDSIKNFKRTDLRKCAV